MGELLRTFSELRHQNLVDLTALDLRAPDLARQGMHPTLGPVTAQQLLATWVAHDLNHIHQIAKSMAYQYRDNLGPWLAFIPFNPQS
jgi:hypothetical protein